MRGRPLDISRAFNRPRKMESRNMNLRKAYAVFSLCVLLMATGFYTTAASETSVSCPNSAQQYWEKFRGDVLGHNLPMITNQSQFPFELRGLLDESEKKQINRNDFIKVFPKLLSTDPGLSPTATTMKSLVITTSRLSPSFCNAYGNQFRVGTWVFELKPEGWRFVQAFIDD